MVLMAIKSIKKGFIPNYTRDGFDKAMAEALKDPTDKRWFLGMTYRYHAHAIKAPAFDYQKIHAPMLVACGTKDSLYQIKVIRPVLDRCEDTGMLGAKSDNIQYISAMSDDAAQGRSRSKTGLITLIWYEMSFELASIKSKTTLSEQEIQGPLTSILRILQMDNLCRN